MPQYHRKIELLANIAIIVVSLLLGAVLVQRFFLQPSDRTAAAPRQNIKPGTKISLPDVDWSQRDSNLLIVLQKGCSFCTESAPFYQRLLRNTASRTDLQLIAALPQDIAAGKQYLNEIQLPTVEVRQASLSSIGVLGTPTLLLIDKTGTVSDVWFGRLPPDKESEVFNRLQIKQ